MVGVWLCECVGVWYARSFSTANRIHWNWLGWWLWMAWRRSYRGLFKGLFFAFQHPTRCMMMCVLCEQIVSSLIRWIYLNFFASDMRCAMRTPDVCVCGGEGGECRCAGGLCVLVVLVFCQSAMNWWPQAECAWHTFSETTMCKIDGRGLDFVQGYR